MVGEKRTIEVVWFKRDLRLADHRPLVEAARRGPVLPLYIVEPSQVNAPDFDPSHWTFLRESLIELREGLAKRGQPLVVRVGEVLPILQSLASRIQIRLWAHEETSNWQGYQRDRAVRRWARETGIAFQEFPSNGVVRRLRSRDEWSEQWEERMCGPLLAVPESLPMLSGVDPGPIPTHAELGLPPDLRQESLQRGGPSRASIVLESFLKERGAAYRGGISSPLSAPSACSRLSPYLAWGNLSTRQVVQATRQRMREVGPRWAASLQAFESRLHWRCHFIQKLEDEPSIEFTNFVRAYDGLRESQFNHEAFSAWQRGETGYPMIDACMRMLRATGWLNFRMRSMLMAFAAYDLWLHWPEPAHHLARLFLDYEPGIHYPQVQMQAGTAGHATLRLYNPVKQGQDHDPRGAFVRRWIPALARVPDSFVHTPWLLPEGQQESLGCRIGRDYPVPIVDHARAVTEARARIAQIRRNPAFAAEVARVFDRHGSRRRSLVGPRSRRQPASRSHPSPDDRQLSLF
jgi:deoxyribodipyrimidine photo-lyase